MFVTILILLNDHALNFNFEVLICILLQTALGYITVMEMEISQFYSVTCTVIKKVTCYSAIEEVKFQVFILAQDWMATLWQFDVTVCGGVMT